MGEWHVSINVTPAFHDLDPMNVVWHGHYFRYFEVARCALLQSLEFDYPQMLAAGYIWPIVDTRVKYMRSMRFQRDYEVTAAITECENRLRIDYAIRDAVTGERVCKAHTVQVAVDVETGEMQYVSPNVLLDKLRIPVGDAP